MKFIAAVLIVGLTSFQAAAAEIVTTTDGRTIELRPNGTYTILDSGSGGAYTPLDTAVFRAFPDDYVGQKVSHVVMGNVRSIDLERGWTLVDIDPGRSVNKILDISSLPRKTLIELGGCVRCTFTFYGEVMDFVGRRGIGFKAHRIDLDAN